MFVAVQISQWLASIDEDEDIWDSPALQIPEYCKISPLFFFSFFLHFFEGKLYSFNHRLLAVFFFISFGQLKISQLYKIRIKNVVLGEVEIHKNGYRKFHIVVNAAEKARKSYDWHLLIIYRSSDLWTTHTTPSPTLHPTYLPPSLPDAKRMDDLTSRIKHECSQVHVSDFNLILTLILKVSGCILAIDLLSVRRHRWGKSPSHLRRSSSFSSVLLWAMWKTWDLWRLWFAN